MMKIYSVTDPEFKPYGKILEGYDTAELFDAVRRVVRADIYPTGHVIIPNLIKSLCLPALCGRIGFTARDCP